MSAAKQLGDSRKGPSVSNIAHIPNTRSISISPPKRNRFHNLCLSGYAPRLSLTTGGMSFTKIAQDMCGFLHNAEQTSHSGYSPHVSGVTFARTAAERATEWSERWWGKLCAERVRTHSRTHIWDEYILWLKFCLSRFYSHRIAHIKSGCSFVLLLVRTNSIICTIFICMVGRV